jgi:hypothetical protein
LDAKEFFKIAAVLFLYGLCVPALGLLLRWRPNWQRPVFALVCFMTLGGILNAAEWGITLDFFLYRGHAKGYHFYFVEIPALALLTARVLEDWRKFRFCPPGLWLYFLYCALSFVSIINAPFPEYVLMAAFKYLKVALFFVLAYNFLRNEKDLHFFLQVMCVVMFWEMAVVLKMKYLDGMYQVRGTFEHQNSLSMYVTMIGLVFLAVSLGPRHPWSNLYFIGYVACAVIQQATLSRAGLVIYAAGTLAVSLLGLIERVTRRRLLVLATLGCVGVIGLTMTLDTILLRFRDPGTQSSAKTRELLNIASRQMLADYSLGIGWNNFGRAINKPFPYGKVIDQWERAGGARVDEDAPKGIAESLYWLLLAETGFQGLLGFILFVFIFLWKNVRAIVVFRCTFLGSISLGILLGFTCNYLQSFLERVLTQPRNAMLWMMLLGIVARIDTLRRYRKWQQSIAREPKRAEDFAHIE